MNTDATDLQDRLIEMITSEITFGAAVEPGTDLLLTGLVDSIGVVRIVAWLEQELGIEIDPTDVLLENFQTVTAMLAYLRSR